MALRAVGVSEACEASAEGERCVGGRANAAVRIHDVTGAVVVVRDATAAYWGARGLCLPLCRILIAFSRDLIAFCRWFDSAQGRFDGFLIAQPFMMLPVAREESYAYR